MERGPCLPSLCPCQHIPHLLSCPARPLGLPGARTAGPYGQQAQGVTRHAEVRAGIWPWHGGVSRGRWHLPGSLVQVGCDCSGCQPDKTCFSQSPPTTQKEKEEPTTIKTPPKVFFLNLLLVASWLYIINRGWSSAREGAWAETHSLNTMCPEHSQLWAPRRDRWREGFRLWALALLPCPTPACSDDCAHAAPGARVPDLGPAGPSPPGGTAALSSLVSGPGSCFHPPWVRPV